MVHTAKKRFFFLPVAPLNPCSHSLTHSLSLLMCACFVLWGRYTGNDCGTAIASKVFAWFPLDVDAIDLSGNKVLVLLYAVLV